jgi:transcriptional regulator with XRE-family HTH domain
MASNKSSNKGEVLKNLLGSNIKRFRVNSGFSQEELSEKAGISVPFLGAIERGEKWPSPANLAGIAQGLGVNPYDLLKPEKTASQDIKKITSKLTKDITVLVNQSVKMMNTVANECNKPKKQKK